MIYFDCSFIAQCYSNYVRKVVNKYRIAVSQLTVITTIESFFAVGTYHAYAIRQTLIRRL